MSEADADHHRYRALLRHADDEPKRLALIQLLIDERARDRLAVRLKPSRPEPSPEYEPVATPMPAQRLVSSHEVAEPAPRLWFDEPGRSAAADDAPIDSADWAARPSISEPEPPTPPFQPPASGPEPTELAPEEMTAAAEKVAVVSAASIPSDSSRPDDLADRVARFMSGRVASANAGPVAPVVSSPGPPLVASDVEIAARIEAALTELTRVHRPQEQLHGGEARLSLPAPAPSEMATPEAMRSVPTVRTATHDLIERFARLLGKRLAAPAAAIPSVPAAPPFDDEEEDSIVRQIQAALAKQKGDS
jgi:hypothetical protein